MRIGIVDDEKEGRELLKELCEIWLLAHQIECQFDIFKSGKELTQYCTGEDVPNMDILFLDINMPGMDGIQVKEWLNHYEGIRRIIFVTSHEEAMQSAFGYKVIAFVRKPIQERDVFKWLGYVRQEQEKNELLVLDGLKEEIYLDQVEYIKSDGNYATIYLRDSGRQILFVKKLKQIEEELGSRAIVRVHNSYMVNLMYISGISEKSINIRERNYTIPVGRTRRKQFKERYDRYNIDKIKRRME